MVREEANEYRARANELDERDHEILLSLLEHKVLTTDQVKAPFFRSLRRCQYRLRELRDLGFIASFTPKRGFGDGRPPACWFPTKTGLRRIGA
jgi:predicted transcriptional regulator